MQDSQNVNPTLDSGGPGVPACRECGLFRHALTWCVPDVVDTRETIKDVPARDLPLILIVGQSPNRVEDERAGIFTPESQVGGFLRQFLDHLEVRWRITNVARCFPGRSPESGGDTKPTDAQIHLCTSEFLTSTLVKEKPAVIVCLGEIAMRGVLGKSAPKTMRGAGKDAISLDLGGGEIIHVLVTPHPINHVMGREDLFDEYCRVFTLADDLAMGRSEVPALPFPRVQVETREKFEEIVRRVESFPGSPIIVDIEDHHYLKLNKDDEEDVLRAATAWHPDSLMFCKGFGWYEGDWESVSSAKEAAAFMQVAGRTAVCFDEALQCRDLWIRLLSNRIIVPHNAKYEVNGVYAYEGGLFKRVFPDLPPLDYLEIAKRTNPAVSYSKRDVYPYIDCTLYFNYAQNIGNAENSLKDQAKLRYDAPDWERPTKLKVAQADAAFKKARSELAKQIKTCMRESEKAREKEPLKARAMLEHAQRLTEQRSKIPSRASYLHCDRETMFVYNAHDIWFTLWLYLDVRREMIELVRENPSMLTAIELFRRNLYTVSKMERAGIPIDRERLTRYSALLDRRAREIKLHLLRSEIVRECLIEAGQLTDNDMEDPEKLLDAIGGLKRKFLERLLDREPLKEECPWTDGGEKGKPQPSLNDDVLELFCGGEPGTPEEKRPKTWAEWQDKTELQKIWWGIKALRRVDKLRGTFVKGIEQYAHPIDDRIRPDFYIAKVARSKSSGASASGSDAQGGGTETARLASSRPNSQNWDKDKAFRSLIRAKHRYCPVEKRWKGRLLFELDFSQVEPVFLSIIANIPEWIAIFQDKLDLYCYIANKVYKQGLPREALRSKHAVPGWMRDVCKIVVLATMYGIGPEDLARQTGITVEEAKQFLREFDEQFPEIPAWKAKVRAMVRSRTPIVTRYGRRRLFDYRPNMSLGELGDLDREAINFQIQSEGSGDTNCWQAYEVQKYLDRPDVTAVLINMVHDSNWGEGDIDRIPEEVGEIKRIMEDTRTLPYEMPIQIPTTAKVGPDLATMWEFDPATGLVSVKVKEQKDPVPMNLQDALSWYADTYKTRDSGLLVPQHELLIPA